MATPAVRIASVSKRYLIGPVGHRAPYRTFREAVTDLAAAPFRRLRRLRGAAPAEDTLWALKDVTFEVQPGEVVGIVGRNGAGKSTLLKILSRVTEPTEGRVELHGRVASLLEVGTGFHPELTGRENIFLNGAILGMYRREIERRLDEIVAFAEVERFIETPVKHYSSGMQMRLAFAVAAHLEQEILLIDEVLAVGDAAFQKKCLGRMEAVAGAGRTVLFVSHNMPVVRQLCQRGVLLQQGRVARIGKVDEIVDAYLADVHLETELRFPEREDVAATITRLCIRDAAGRTTTRVPHSSPFVGEIEYVVREPLAGTRLWWMLARTDGIDVIESGDPDSPQPLPEVRRPGRYVATVRVPGGILNGGTYQYRVALANTSGHITDYRFGTHFEIFDDTDFGALNAGGRRAGVVLLRLEWRETRMA